MSDIKIPIKKLAESPKASESVMTVSAMKHLSLGDAIIQTLCILSKDATEHNPEPKKPAA